MTLRFFAAARSAVGASEKTVTLDAPASIHQALETTRSDAADYDEIMGRCSFLVNAIAERDRDRQLLDGDIVDVLPPFAGG